MKRVRSSSASPRAQSQAAPEAARDELPATVVQAPEQASSLDSATISCAAPPVCPGACEATARAFDPTIDLHVAQAAHWLAQTLEHHTNLTRIPAENAGELTQARRTAQNLATLLTLRSGHEPLSPAPLDIGDLVMTVLPAWKPRAPRHTFELALLGDTPPIVADAERVGRAVEGLLAAVVRATPEGATVRVSVRPGPMGSDDVVLSVRHSEVATGVPYSDDDLFGVPAPDSQHIATAPNGALDLTLAREIVMAHGGRVEIESGSTGQRHSLAIITAWPLVPRVTPPSGPRTSASRLQSPPGVTSRAEKPFVARERPLILVAEGEPRMARYLKANLEAQGYSATVAQDIAAARRVADLEAPDLVLLDGGLEGDGRLEPLRRLIADGGCPVVILARRSDPLACAQALDVGAEDWLARPFTSEELLARIRAALRRHQPNPQRSLEAPITVGELTIDLAQRLVSVADRTVALSKTEYKLLSVLARAQGAVLTHDALLERVWGPGYGDAVQFVWVYIRRLRRKLEPDPANPRFILTVPGIGYRLAQG